MLQQLTTAGHLTLAGLCLLPAHPSTLSPSSPLLPAPLPGELDETDSDFGNEGGLKQGDSDQAELPADQDAKQFVVA